MGIAANDWQQAIVLGGFDMPPWKIENSFVQVVSTAEHFAACARHHQ
jgi:hypothetical protein